MTCPRMRNRGMHDSNDPVFNELQVWVDANGDGVSQPTELTRLAQQNITSINYAGNTFTRAVNGTGNNAGTVTLTTGLLASPDLLAERDGTQQTLIADGLLIQSSNGTLSLIVNNGRTAGYVCERRHARGRGPAFIAKIRTHRSTKRRSGGESWSDYGRRLALGAGFMEVTK